MSEFVYDEEADAKRRITAALIAAAVASEKEAAAADALLIDGKLAPKTRDHMLSLSAMYLRSAKIIRAQAVAQ